MPTFSGGPRLLERWRNRTVDCEAAGGCRIAGAIQKTVQAGPLAVPSNY